MWLRDAMGVQSEAGSVYIGYSNSKHDDSLSYAVRIAT